NRLPDGSTSSTARPTRETAMGAPKPATVEANDNTSPPPGPVKDLYEVGEIPPLGHVPRQMHAWCIRRERHGPPDQAMQVEVVDVPALDSNEVLILVMSAGVNYNGVWAALGQ